MKMPQQLRDNDPDRFRMLIAIHAIPWRKMQGQAEALADTVSQSAAQIQGIGMHRDAQRPSYRPLSSTPQAPASTDTVLPFANDDRALPAPSFTPVAMPQIKHAGGRTSAHGRPGHHNYRYPSISLAARAGPKRGVQETQI
jgi:hypothetical protein